MNATHHTLDAKIPYFFKISGGCMERANLLVRVTYQYDPPPDKLKLPFLDVVGARILYDDKVTPRDVNEWVQDWLDLDGYERAREHAEHERAEHVS
jgi:hypothetical protein